MKGLKKVCLIGSGPIIIGQAAEFDYAGTQALYALKEDKIKSVLINSNPATIMTDKDIADKVYIEPLEFKTVERILEKEKPDALLAGFGGQTGLNLAMELSEKGVLKKLGIKLIGVNKEAIKKAEDRDEFKKLMNEIGEPIPKSIIANSYSESKKFADKEGYPLIIRPAYTLGGSGGGIANNESELKKFVRSGLSQSMKGQILLEKSVAGWKEIEFEVMRDSANNCITICGMENFDPVGIHTGDSIVVCPIQTLRDREYQRLRSAALKIIRALKIEGGCNVQFAMHPKTGEYIVIEVNPRVSRSSALASKAAGYPIARLACKIAIGYKLTELKNYVTKKTSALFEPSLDYIVVKYPKWPFDKFKLADRTLGTQMKATGEVMAIARSFECALLKAVTSLEIKVDGLRIPFITEMEDKDLLKNLKEQTDERLFIICEILRRGLLNISELHKRTMIDNWFLYKLENIVKKEKELADIKGHKKLSSDMKRTVIDAEKIGFTDEEISFHTGLTHKFLQKFRDEKNTYPVYKTVDTCSGEFDARTPYFYSSWDTEDEAEKLSDKSILVIGSGPIRIGQGIEFDYTSVKAIKAIKKLGYKAIIINNNPETLSTDFDISDRLYFEPLHYDDVLNIIDKEKPYGVFLQFGGQTSLNLAERLDRKKRERESGSSPERGRPAHNETPINILGSSFNAIDLCEDREKFIKMMNELKIKVPEGYGVTNKEEAIKIAEKLGYPVLVRPSYVIGGRSMQVVYSDKELLKYLKEAKSLEGDHNILIDKYIDGTEFEIDAISDGKDVLVPGIMEHIEKTGVHSGDSFAVYPPITLGEKVKKVATIYAKKIAVRAGLVGLFNIQFAYDGEDIFVIEVNPRGSRTVPILTKVTGVPMTEIAVRVSLGEKLRALKYGTGLYKESKKYFVKAPVFSSAKLEGVDIAIGPEMRSTGEVLGNGKSFEEALYKAFLGTRIIFPKKGESIYVSLRDFEKTGEVLKVIEGYKNLGFKIFASKGTAKFLRCEYLSDDEVYGRIGDEITLIINTPEIPNKSDEGDFSLRTRGAQYMVPVFTRIETAKAFLSVCYNHKGYF